MTALEARPSGAAPVTAVALLDLLAALDDLLAEAVAVARDRHGVSYGEDRLRGIYVGPEQVERALDRAPGAPFGLAGPEGWTGVLDLDPFEAVVVALAVAPEVDSRYEPIFGYLQDDVTRRRPTVGLALDLLCATATERLVRRARFDEDAPLRRGLIQLGPADDGASLLDRPLLLHRTLLRRLLGVDGMDPRLRAACTVDAPGSSGLAALPLAADLRARLHAWLEGGRDRPRRLALSGRDARLLRRTATALAAEVGLPILRVDPTRLDQSDPVVTAALVDEAMETGRLVHVHLPGHHHADVGREAPDAWLDALAALGDVVVTSEVESAGLIDRGFVPARIDLPDRVLRRWCWAEAAGASAAVLDGPALDQLADTYRLTASAIGDAVRSAAARVGGPPTVADLVGEAQRLAAGTLASVARRVDLHHTWDELVLPPDALAQLHELHDRVRCRPIVLEDWGLARSGSAAGLHALFTGPSGTGKTMAAQVVAASLGVELWKVDLATVVSKYIGETEKNLERIFGAARDADVVLLFDEADALFGKRSEVRDARDRYANVEVAYLLQRMEEHDGVTLLATNLRQNLDDAFLRRLAFTIHFPFPEPAERCRIWTQHLAALPVAEGIDLASLAASHRLSGGQIRNVTVAAAYLAAAAGTAIQARHLDHAVDRELQKLGKPPAVEP